MTLAAREMTRSNQAGRSDVTLPRDESPRPNASGAARFFDNSVDRLLVASEPLRGAGDRSSAPRVRDGFTDTGRGRTLETGSGWAPWAATPAGPPVRPVSIPQSLLDRGRSELWARDGHFRRV